MTDFYARLEDELVAAGRRRQAQGKLARTIAGREPRLLAAVATVAALAAGVAAGLPALLASSPKSTPAVPVAPATAPPPTAQRDGSLAGIRVAVFNGTTRPGSARSTAARLEARGAVIVIVGSNPSQSVDRTTVHYWRGAVAQARRVAAALGVARVGPWGGSTAEPDPPPGARVDVFVVLGYRTAAQRAEQSP